MTDLPEDLQSVLDTFGTHYKRTYEKSARTAAAANVLLDRIQDDIATWVESDMLTPGEALQVLTDLCIGGFLASVNQGLVEEVK